MLMIVQGANHYPCPKWFGTTNHPTGCIARGCPAWRWFDAAAEHDANATWRAPKLADLQGVSLPGDSDRIYMPRRGYCGFAGEVMFP